MTEKIEISSLEELDKILKTRLQLPDQINLIKEYTTIVSYPKKDPTINSPQDLIEEMSFYFKHLGNFEMSIFFETQDKPTQPASTAEIMKKISKLQKWNHRGTPPKVKMEK